MRTTVDLLDRDLTIAVVVMLGLALDESPLGAEYAASWATVVAQETVLVGFAQYGVGHSGGGSHQHDFLAVYGAAAADDLVADVVDGSAIRRLFITCG
jgi:hypothetical protein